ncbi:hypothetical protein JCM18899A_33060 [Nocardioides sp. AN3]
MPSTARTDLTWRRLGETVALLHRAAELRAACRELTHTGDHLVATDAIAGRIDLGTTTLSAGAMETAVDIAESAKVPLVDGQTLTGPARRLDARLKGEADELRAAGHLPTDDEVHVAIGDKLHNRTIIIPEPLLSAIRSSATTAALAASTAAAALGHAEQPRVHPTPDPSPEQSRPTPGAHRPTPPIPGMAPSIDAGMQAGRAQ